MEAGSIGVTTIDHPAPRWSHYIFKLRKAGLIITTEYEPHIGPFPGKHGRYRLNLPSSSSSRPPNELHQSRSPLTAAELKRRAAALTANQPTGANSEHFSDGSARSEPSDERQYGPTAARVLRDAKRGVALHLVRPSSQFSAEAAATLADAVVSQWVPKNVMVDRLNEIAVAHSSSAGIDRTSKN